MSPSRPPARWSKKTDELVRYVALRCRPSLQSELGHWLESSSRFRDFVTVHQDKVRKKLNGAQGEETRLDVRAELLVGYLALAHRRFEIAFEAYGSHRAGPDLTVTYRSNQRFNLEVTRLRTTDDPTVGRLAEVIRGKLRQLPSDLPNGLVITTRGLSLTEAHLVAATRLLKMHNDSGDDAFFARSGFAGARDFYARYLHLGGIFVLDETDQGVRTIFSANREARRPLPTEAVAALIARLNVPTG
jgi:hypothetical protein